MPSTSELKHSPGASPVADADRIMAESFDDDDESVELSIASVGLNGEQVPKGSYNKFLKQELANTATPLRTYFKGFDKKRACEVAWISIQISGDFTNNNGEVKTINADSMAHRINTEVRLMKDLDNKYIPRLVHFWRNKAKAEQEVVLITELFSSNLRHFILKAEKLRLSGIRKWCSHILEGLRYLHTIDKPIIHRNLKCSNIFVKGGNGDIKIGNFFMAVNMKDVSKDILDMDFYAEGIFNVAPEILAGIKDYDTGVDIYEFGMTVLEMITVSVFHGRKPYWECGKNKMEIIRRKMEGILPDDLFIVGNSNLRDFILQCLMYDPETGRRPNVDTLLKHPFFNIGRARWR